MKKILNNPIRLIQNGDISSFYAPFAFYFAFFDTIKQYFPHGYVDIYYFISEFTPFHGSVLRRFWIDIKDKIKEANPQWFIDPYTIKIDWSNFDDTCLKLSWLSDVLIKVINGQYPPFFEGLCFDIFLSQYYKDYINKDLD